MTKTELIDNFSKTLEGIVFRGYVSGEGLDAGMKFRRMCNEARLVKATVSELVEAVQKLPPEKDRQPLNGASVPASKPRA